ncbi:MAG: hypothetical protein U0350_28610 [Caldilineaceae bacterium]
MSTQFHFFRNLFRRPRLAGLLCGASLAVAQFFSPAGVGTAQAATPTCTANGGTQNCTITFAYTGAAETWTVPAGVTQATFDLYGAQGGAGGGNQSVRPGSGGLGGEAKATLSVTAGATYQINVGGAGGAGTGTRDGAVGAGGFNGGAPGGNGDTFDGGSGGGGGGASDVRTGANGFADRLLGPVAAAAAAVEGAVAVVAAPVITAAAGAALPHGQGGSGAPRPVAAAAALAATAAGSGGDGSSGTGGAGGDGKQALSH